MAPRRVVMAMQAMKAIGIPSQTVKPVLKNLLKVYDNNWELIEEENYRVLADAIFDFQEEEVRKKKVEKCSVEDQNKETWTDDAYEPRRTIKRLQQEDDHSSPSMHNPGIVLGKSSVERQKLDEAASAETCLRQEKSEAASTQTCLAEKRKNLVSTQADVREKRQKLDEAASAETCLRQEKPEAISTQTCLAEKRKNPVSTRAYVREKGPEHVSPPLHVRGEGIESVSFQTHLIEQRTEPVLPPINPRGKSSASERNYGMNCFKWPKIEPSTEPLPDGAPNYHLCSTLIKPKSEPFTGDLPHFEFPIAVVLPPTLDPARKKAPDSVNQVGASIESGTTKRTGPTDALTLNYADKEDEMQDSLPDITMNNGTGLELVTVPEASPGNIEIASSTFGEVKLSLTFNSVLDRSDFHIPNLDAVLKLVEDKFLNTYRLAEPSFSAMKLMKELCQCFLELGSDSNDGKMERNVNVNPEFFDSLKESNIENFSDANGNLHISNFSEAANLSNGLANGHCLFNMVAPEVPRPLLLNGNNGLFHHSQPILRIPVCFNSDKDKEELEGSEPSKVNSQSMVVAPQCCLSLDDEILLHDVNDICKGEERVRISVVNEVSSEQYPPSFYYIPQNIVYQNAYLNFSLARIGDENCCSDCFGNCLSSAIPCACARETGGEYAYTLDGLIKKEFLDDCISMNRDPQKHRLFYCKDCPLERSKNEVQPDACKGHLVRKFIKECWSKCGCNKQCGNRVVQRGITRNLQVFLTTGGKGWGVRTLEELPRGTFICEYVGEVVTNMELYDRTIQVTGKERHTYPVLLDADWGSEGVLKDEEALCLDATFYGNVGRFINHRCYDANLIEIPVEVETPDHHYYHLAFFTTRKVEALEELTWDYGIDFDDHKHPVKAFRCRCGSRFCRDLKPSTRKRQRGVILR